MTQLTHALPQTPTPHRSVQESGVAGLGVVRSCYFHVYMNITRLTLRLILGVLMVSTLLLEAQDKPPLSMQDAVRIAEQHIATEKIDLDGRFLRSVAYDSSGPWTKGTYIGKGPLWLLHWDRYHLKSTDDVFTVVVYVDGKVGHFRS